MWKVWDTILIAVVRGGLSRLAEWFALCVLSFLVIRTIEEMRWILIPIILMQEIERQECV